MSNPTTEGRPGLRISSKHPLIADLEALARKHGLIGCVLIGFDRPPKDLVSMTAASESPIFLAAMKRLGDQMLARIDNGEFDPDEQP
jgi:hypothetical protein